MKRFQRILWCAALLAAAAPMGAAEAASVSARERELMLETGRLEEVLSAAEAETDGNLRQYWRSRVEFYRGEYGRAAEEITAALSSGGNNPEGEFLQRYYRYLRDVTADFEEFSSEHFRFRAGGDDCILAGYALEALEKAYAEIGADLNCFPREKILVEVFSRKEEFAAASTLGEEILEKSGTVGICKFNRLMILSPRALPLGYRWLDTLAHEYTHYLVNRVSGGRCPLWLHEGVARYHDTRWRLENPAFLTPSGENRLLRALRNKELISFKRMHPSLVFLKDQDEISLAFAQVSSAIACMKQDYGPDTVGRLLAALAGGDEKKAFKSVLGTSPAVFEKRLAGYLARLSLRESPGAMDERVRFDRVPEEEFVGADSRGQVRLGDRMRELGRTEAALFHYEKALVSEPANPVILLKSAKVLAGMGNDDKALERLTLAVEKNPHYVTPRLAMGELYYRRREFAKAVESCSEALSMNPFDPDTHYLLSRCYLVLGERDKAVREMQIRLVLNPHDIETKLLHQRLAPERVPGAENGGARGE